MVSPDGVEVQSLVHSLKDAFALTVTVAGPPITTFGLPRMFLGFLGILPTKRLTSYHSPHNNVELLCNRCDTDKSSTYRSEAHKESPMMRGVLKGDTSEFCSWLHVAPI